MKKYLAVFYHPSIGDVIQCFEATDAEEADDMAFEWSAKDPDLLTGDYDLYQIVRDRKVYHHTLLPISGGQNGKEW